MKVQKWFIQRFLTKTSLAALAAAVSLLASAPAHADTSWVRGGNWGAPNGDGGNGSIIYPDGITSSTTAAEAAALADTISGDYAIEGMNFVRIGINPATISGDWPVIQACANELVNDGLYVDLCDFGTNNDGSIDNFNNWKAMWQTVDGVYSNNSSVYYEPLNEPHSYSSESVLASDVYVPFLGFITKSQNHLILDGTGYADHVGALGGDSRFNNCLLGVHIYPFWNTSLTNEAQWESALNGEVGGYQSRTVMTEMGAPTTSGLNYGQSANNTDISFIRGCASQCRAWPMGFVYFPAHRDNDGYRLFNSPGGGIVNQSMAGQLQYGWNLNIPLIGALSSSSGQMRDCYRWNSSGTWYIRSGANGSVSTVNWGTAGDVPLIGDWAGYGMRDEVIFRPSNGYSFVLNGTTDKEIGQFQWGTSGDIPLIGAWSTGQMWDTAVFRPSSGTWWIRYENQQTTNLTFGANGDVPMVGDFAGNGMVDLVTWTPSTATWSVFDWKNQQLLTSFQWGTNGDIPVIGAWSTGQMWDTAVFRPSNGNWYIRYENGSTNILHWGTAGDIPMVANYYTNGMVDEVVYRRSSNAWFIRNGVTGQSTSFSF